MEHQYETAAIKVRGIRQRVWRMEAGLKVGEHGPACPPVAEGDPRHHSVILRAAA
jgi:hypothetical protein